MKEQQYLKKSTVLIFLSFILFFFFFSKFYNFHEIKRKSPQGMIDVFTFTYQFLFFIFNFFFCCNQKIAARPITIIIKVYLPSYLDE